MNNVITLEEHNRLIDEGWRYRLTAEEPRVSEIKEFYEDMGLETLVKTGIVDDGSECNCCFTAKGLEHRYKTVYTRGISQNNHRSDDDLF